MNKIGSYINGNYRVDIYDDGTKVRETLHEDATRFIPQFAENCDVKITDKCDGGCPMCYEGCTVNGKHADLRNTVLCLESLHPYTEMALNGNDLTHPDLVWFLRELKRLKVIANLTVNQIHLERNEGLIDYLVSEGLIHGLGISLRKVTPDFIRLVKKYDNAVIHVINGVVTEEQMMALADNGLKVLILGYKMRGRGSDYFDDNIYDIGENMKWLKANLKKLIPHFKVISFDNLAIAQLRVRDLLSDEKWNEFYMGDDGDYTFYMDLVKGEFAQNSVTNERHPLMRNIDDMFNRIRDEKSRMKSE